MSKPKVSIITVVYNDVNHIEKSIVDTLEQTYDNFEYIIIDGGSTDGTKQIIENYSDKITKWISEPDKGIYDAMIKGYKLASGDWLLFHNCGDFFENPGVLELVFANADYSSYSLIACASRAINADSSFEMKPRYPQRSFFEVCPFLHTSTFIRRDVQLKYGYDLQFRNSADYDFFVRVLKDYRPFIVLDTIVSLVDISYGATSENYLTTLKDNIRLLNKNEAPFRCIMKYQRKFLKHRIKRLLNLRFR